MTLTEWLFSKEMENKQTAVEWLIEQIKKDSNIRLRGLNLDELEEQAKQMEKEQLENARPQITSNCVIKEISDEKIRHAAYRDETVNIGIEPESAFIDGAKWYREQLKKM